MIPVPNLELVLIIPDEIEETFKLGDKDAAKSEAQKENERRAQSRGTIFAVGNGVEFWENGDKVSFYRAAATEITEDGKSYFSINQANILCKFITDAKR